MSQTGTITFNSITDIRHLFNVSFYITQWIEDGIHGGNIQIRIKAIFPDLSEKELLFQYPSQPYDLSVPGYGFQVTYASMDQIDLKVTAPDEVIKWACTGSGCVESPYGQYSTKESCDSACKEPPGESLKLTVDKSVVNIGDTVTFTASVNKPDGTVINLYQQLVLGTDFLIGTGTLVNGYCTIKHTFTADGTVVHYACTPGIISTCDLQSNLVPITIGKTNYVTTALYAVGILAGAYIIGQYLNNRRIKK